MNKDKLKTLKEAEEKAQKIKEDYGIDFEYYDYLDGIPKYSWANKKYLVRIEESK